ncbi:MAG: glucose 1-dehydrogenase [Spirochaetaceae bacterium]|nr:MAG: glucose 1-dehydrogenase [Spirochaetaceae bacterium]
MEERVAVITGSGRGIGRAVAERYADAGVRVVIAEKDQSAGRGAEREINTRVGGRTAPDGPAPGPACFIRTDVARPDDIDAMVASAFERFGRIDVLVNNAGIGRGASPYDLTVDAWDEVIAVNLRGTFLCSRAVARVMRGRGGSIVNIASTRALMSEPNTEAYSASKGGIVALTHALAASLGPDGIRVNCISPGWICTGDYDALTDADHSQHLSGRVGRPEDIARACLYLSDPANGFITGANLVIDGGMTRTMIYQE